MTELLDLQQRVAIVEELFKASNDVIRKRSEQLAELTSAMEEGFADSQNLVESLREELVRAQNDHRELRAMLESLLAATEEASVSKCELEARLSHLIETASSIGAGQKSEGRSPTTGVGRPLPQQSEEGKEEKGQPAPEASTDEEEQPLELTQMILEDGSVADVNREPPSLNESRRVVERVRQSVARRGRE